MRLRPIPNESSITAPYELRIMIQSRGFYRSRKRSREKPAKATPLLLAADKKYATILTLPRSLHPGGLTRCVVPAQKPSPKTETLNICEQNSASKMSLKSNSNRRSSRKQFRQRVSQWMPIEDRLKHRRDRNGEESSSRPPNDAPKNER